MRAFFVEGMIVVHDQQDQRDPNDPAQCRSCQRPLIHRYPEELEDHVADRDVNQDQQEFHVPAPFSPRTVKLIMTQFWKSVLH